MRWLIVLLFCLEIVYGQRIGSKLDTTQIKLGEPLKLSVLITELGNKSVQFPITTDTLNGPFEVLSQRIDSLRIKEKAALQKEWTLSVYEPGEYLLKPVAVLVGEDTLRTRSFRVKVLDVETDSAGYFGNKPLIKTEFTLKDYWNKYWIYALLAVLLIVALFVVLFLYLKDKRKGLGKTEKSLPPFDKAIQALSQLDEEADILTVKQYYSRLANIFRNYVGERYQFDSQYLLSQDLLGYLKCKHDFPTELQIDFSQYLLDSDLVKYAKAKPKQEQTDYYRKLVEDVIRKTKPLEVMVEGESLLKEGEQYKRRNYG